MRTEICNFKIEYMKNPIGVDTPFPHYSWEFESKALGVYQEAFRIIVEGVFGELFWDSEWIKSDETFNILHKGLPLIPDYKYTATLYARIGGEETKATANFSTGLLDNNFTGALWIEASKKSESLLRKTFLTNKGISFAHLYISARGFYEPYLNGKRIGNRILCPAMLNSKTYPLTAIADTYDITDYLTSDNNTIGVRLAQGYKKNDFNNNGWVYSGNEKLWCAISIVYEDGNRQTIISDDSWIWHKGAVEKSSIYHGETYNKNKEVNNWTSPYIDTSAWENCTISEKQEEILNLCTVPVIRKKALKCLKFEAKGPESTICDFGEVGAGKIRIKIMGEPKTKIHITHSENIFEDNSLNPHTNMSAKALDTYILKGHEIEIYEPDFTYHSFRYAEIRIEGVAQLISAEKIVIGADLDETGEFKCNDTMISRMFSNAKNSIETNLLYFPANCGANDERIPDIRNSSVYNEFSIHCFDMRKFYKIWLENIKGGNTECNPMCRGEIISLPFNLEKYYGIEDISKDLYPFMVSALEKCLEKYKETNFADCSGDWCAPREDNLYNEYSKCAHMPKETELAELISLIDKFLYFAKKHNKTTDIEKFERIYSFLKDEFNKKFFEENGGYSGGEQTPNILALEYNIAENKALVYKTLKNHIKDKDNYHINVGIAGIRYLIRTLSKDNEGMEILERMLKAVDFPSFGQQILEYDATSLCQQWLGLEGRMTCHNPMFSGMFADYFRIFGGIKSLEDNFKKISIEPILPSSINEMFCSYKSIRGEIQVSIKRIAEKTYMDFVIPPNCSAMVTLPTGEIKEFQNGKYML